MGKVNPIASSSLKIPNAFGLPQYIAYTYVGLTYKEYCVLRLPWGYACIKRKWGRPKPSWHDSRAPIPVTIPIVYTYMHTPVVSRAGRPDSYNGQGSAVRSRTPKFQHKTMSTYMPLYNVVDDVFGPGYLKW